MNIEQMKAKLLEVYPSASWHAKVEGFNPKRIVAVYRSMFNRGVFDGRTKKGKEKNKRLQEDENHQITIFEWVRWRKEHER